nr:immunoglobulin light chain junction region [Macaca mulatta]
YMQALQTPHSF